MDAVAITIGISWTLAGLLCIVLSIPLIRGRVGRNEVYGVRFRGSFQSDEAWFAINRFGGKRLAVWSVPLVIVGVISFFLPLQSNTALTLVLGFAPLVFILIPLFQSWRFAQRYRPRA
ncbi:MAG TPA: SdpI family protein [Tepidisphaeraceae bacterium]|nr:SdpI family protein [Tepidisphaeraceae bacterium]